MKKRPGLIRWNFFGYLGVAVILTLAYIFVGLDLHVKSLVSQRLTALNGAPVTVGHATFKLSGPRIVLEQITFMDPRNPEFVQLEVQNVKLDLDWQPLLRNRIVVKDGVASGIHLNDLRTPPVPAPVNSLVAPQSSPSLSAASAYLASPGRMELPPEDAWKAVPSFQAQHALNSEISTQVAAWQKKLDDLVATHQQQTQSIESTQQTSHDKEAGSESLRKIMVGHIEKTKLDLDQLEISIKSEANNLLTKTQSLNELIPHDVTVIKQEARLPSVEFNNVAAEVGAEQIRPILSVVDNFYFRLLAWLERTEQPMRNSFGRQQGTEYFFVGKYLPPRLWLQKLDIISKESPDGKLGEVVGHIKDLSSEPFNYPAHLSLQASFKKAEVENLQMEAQIDHTRGQVDDRLQLSVASFLVHDLDFVKTPTFRLGIEQATAKLNMEVLAQTDSSTMTIATTMNKVSYRVETESEALKKVFDDALSPLTSLEMSATAQGKLPALQWTYASNLAERLRTALQGVLSQEFAEYNARLRDKAYQRVLESSKILEASLVTASDDMQKRILAEKEKLVTASSDPSTSKKDSETSKGL